MKSMIKFMELEVVKAVKSLYGEDVDISDVKVRMTPKDIKGDVMVVVQPLLKYSKKTLAETEKEIGEYIFNNNPVISNFESTENEKYIS